MAHSLRLIEDRLAPGAGWTAPLRALHRVIYVLEGAVTLESPGLERPLTAGQAGRAETSLAARAGLAGARLLRFELVRQPPPPTGGGVAVLEHPLGLEPGVAPLIRCDRVDFEPAGVALPHRHRGGGIRRLLRGRLEVTVGEGAPRLMRPGDAWFESGREPVLAVAATDADTSFVRVSVLPAALRGRSSIVYVDPADAARSKPRTYTVLVDDPIALGTRPPDS
jgi:quercetin dioxygenase-like cupin family protein